MKKTLITILMMVAGINVYAYHFSSVCSTGQSLYFDILTDSTVSVTFPCYNSYLGIYYYGYSKPIGNLVIPDSVFHDSVYYKVVRIGSHAFQY